MISLKDISTYRSEVMGWSILWVMMLHFTFNQIPPLGFIAQYGFAGVDIFLFVSGLGLFFSLDRNPDLLHFYKKRLLRIFPTYYLIGLIDSLVLTHDSIPTYLFRYTTIGFWTGGEYGDWYVPSLVVLYLFAPFIKKLFDRNSFVVIAGIIVFFLLCAYYFVDKEHILDRSHFFLLYRVPAFIFGMLCAYWMNKGESMKYFYIILIAGIPFFVILFPQHHQIYNYKYFSLAFLLPLFTLSFILISKALKFTNKAMSAVGKASLEIYLIQGIFFSAMLQGKIATAPAWHDTATILMIIASTLLGLLFHWLIDKSGLLRLL